MPYDIVPWDCFGDLGFGVLPSMDISIWDIRLLGWSCGIALRFGVDEVIWVSFSKYCCPDGFYTLAFYFVFYFLFPL